jgi:hypothetical protein
MSLDSKKKSFVKLSRAVFDSKEWNEKREFSKFEAFLDLIQSAEYKKEGSVIPYNGSKIKIERGQLFATLSYLQNRWNWSSRGKVDKYLKSLKNRNTLETEKRQQGNILTLVNYEVYNGKETDEKQKGNTLETNPRREEEKKEEYYYTINDKLKLSMDDYEKLLKSYSPGFIDRFIFAVENYKKKDKYSNLYRVILSWIAKEEKEQKEKEAKIQSEAPKKEEYKYIRDHF